MREDQETHETHQPKILYFKNRFEKNHKWFNELIKITEDLKNKLPKFA